MLVQKRGKNSWLITINNGSDRFGNRIRITKTIHANSYSEAVRQERIFAGKVAEKNHVNPHNMTLNEFYKYWKEHYLKIQKKQDKTIFSYDEQFTRINAALGHKPIDKIQPKHILIFLEQLKNCPRLDNPNLTLSDNTIRKHYTLLHLLFKKATQWQFIFQNPAENVDPPKYKYSNDKVILNYEELGRFLIALNDEDIKHKLWALLCLNLGLRRGEAIGLQWKDVDLERKFVHIKKTIQYIPRQGLKVKPPKTESSNRILALSNSLIELLRSYKNIKIQHQQRLMNKWQGAKNIEDNFIFTTFYGAISHPDSMNIWLRKFVKKNNLPPISPHSLRHMTATYLINAGVDLVTVAGVMGHVNSTTTQIVYAHVLQKSQNKTAQIMDNILNESISNILD